MNKYIKYFQGQFWRDIRWACWNYKYRTWVRFADKHKLWVNVDRQFIEERKNWRIWPQYQREYE